MDWWLIVDVILAIGATIRLTRAITVEAIGGRLLRDPADRWADRPLRWQPARPLWAEHRRWWADALSCPFCVSTWLAIAAFATMAVAHATDGWFTIAWRIVAAGLTASYVGAHLMVAVGDTDDDEWADDEAPVS